MKFVHTLAGKFIPDHIKRTLEEQPARSGMYNWIMALKGSIAPYGVLKDQLEDYDVIQVNMTPVDMPIIAEMRNKLKNSSTKLVLNNDYVVECWDRWEVDPWYYRQIQKMGDMVFSTEHHQVSQMIPGTFTIPHPTNTKVLKHLGTSQNRDGIGYIYHWWSPQFILPFNLIEQLKSEYNIKKSTMYGFREYAQTYTATQRWKDTMFDDVIPTEEFPVFAERIQSERIIYDPNACHTYGRNGVELACWKRPVVGSNRVFSYNKLFPELTVDPFDAVDTKAKFKLALSGKIDHILDKAYEDVDYFSYENSVKRFKEALDIAIDRGGHEWNQKQ